MTIETVCSDVTLSAGDLTATVELDKARRPLTVRFGSYTVNAELLERAALLVAHARHTSGAPDAILGTCAEHGYFTRCGEGFKCGKCEEPVPVQVPDVCKCGHPACNHRNWEKGQCAHEGCPCGKFVEAP